jgi:TonB-linked SusC/RagA family outer membrane protein
MANIPEISKLKLRGSWGQIGNEKINYNNSFNKGIRGVGNMYVEATFQKNFVAKSSFGIDAGYNKNENFSPAYAVLYYDGTESMQKHATSSLTKESRENLTWLWENTLNYNQVFGKHSISAVAGYTMQNSNSEVLSVSSNNIIRDASDFWYIQWANMTDAKNEVDAGLNYSMISYLARLNYTYNEKYILTGTFRRDGSSKFATENRWSIFPSAAAGWNISKESFMGSIPEISKLKLRGSWGQIGNEKIDYSNRFSLTENIVTVFGTGDVIYPGTTYSKSGNPDLRWEVTTQTDIGLEIGLFKDKLTGEFDYYNRTTDDILVALSTPGFLGNGSGQTIYFNAGKVQNRGFEANINWRDEIGEVGYSVGILASTIHNEVLSVGGSSGVDSLLFGGNIKGYLTQSRKGLPIGAFYGYKTDGIFQNQAELDAYPHTGDAGIGDLRRVDVNGDKVINDQDRTYIGSPVPKFIFGFNAEVTYKNFDVSFSLQGQTGNKIYNAKEFIRPDAYNFEQHVMDRWTGEGTSNTEPRASFGGYNYIPSDKYIQDGSFVRLRSLVVGYTLPEAITAKMHMQQFRVYAKGNNIYTLTRYTGYTPEIGVGDVLGSSIDTGIYPVSAVYSFGVTLTF